MCLQSFWQRNRQRMFNDNPISIADAIRSQKAVVLDIEVDLMDDDELGLLSFTDVGKVINGD